MNGTPSGGRRQAVLPSEGVFVYHHIPMARKTISRSFAAALLGVTPETVSNYVKRGILTGIPRPHKTKTWLYLYEDEVLARCGTVRRLTESEANLEDTFAEISRKQAEADALLKKSVAAVLGASRSEAILRRLVALVGVLVEKTSAMSPSFTSADKDILVMLLHTADLKKVCSSTGLSDEGVKVRIGAAIARITRAVNAFDVIREQGDRIFELEERNARLEAAIASAGKGQPSVGDAELTRIIETRNKLLLGINAVGLSVRAYNCCRGMGIATVADLLQYSRP